MNPQNMMMANDVPYSPQELECLVRVESDQEEQAVSGISNPQADLYTRKYISRQFLDHI